MIPQNPLQDNLHYDRAWLMKNLSWRILGCVYRPVIKLIPYVLRLKIRRVWQLVRMITLKSFRYWIVLSVEVCEGSERPLLVSAGMDVCNLDATGKFERYITGEDKTPPILSTHELFWFNSDLVVECAATDVDHRAFATFRLVIFGLGDEEGKVVTLSRESPEKWKQNGLLKLWVHYDLRLYQF